jgi:hypothetical protein
MIPRQKIHYPVTDHLLNYLKPYGRISPIPLVYDDLRGFSGAIPYEDPKGNETLWLSVIYPPEIMAILKPKLTEIYAVLKIGGDLSLAEHLSVERIDFGDFGNSKPFRIRITNQFNGNSDYYYVKQADASRIYGLELEHVLSPNRMNYLVNGNTLIEEHIAGVPGDIFLKEYLPKPELNRVRIAKEFTKFNERCFLRLLGDMRSVNYVVDITPDFEEVQYRVRPIDFDQQSYERLGKTYMAFRFDSNRTITRLAFKELNRKVIDQYIEEERSQMARRAGVEIRRLTALMRAMRREELAPPEHVESLRKELNRMHKTAIFDSCRTMGDLTASHLTLRLSNPGGK